MDPVPEQTASADPGVLPSRPADVVLVILRMTRQGAAPETIAAAVGLPVDVVCAVAYSPLGEALRTTDVGHDPIGR